MNREEVKMINMIMAENWRHQYTILAYYKMAICRDHCKYKNVHVLIVYIHLGTLRLGGNNGSSRALRTPVTEFAVKGTRAPWRNA